MSAGKTEEARQCCYLPPCTLMIGRPVLVMEMSWRWRVRAAVADFEVLFGRIVVRKPLLADVAQHFCMARMNLSLNALEHLEL